MLIVAITTDFFFFSVFAAHAAFILPLFRFTGDIDYLRHLHEFSLFSIFLFPSFVFTIMRMLHWLFGRFMVSSLYTVVSSLIRHFSGSLSRHAWGAFDASLELDDIYADTLGYHYTLRHFYGLRLRHAAAHAGCRHTLYRRRFTPLSVTLM